MERHWSRNELLEMALEKLQMVATCNMPGAQKMKILKWWNSSAPSREARKFPQKPVSENLPLFLAKCVWYAGVRELFLLYTGVQLVMIGIHIVIQKLPMAA